MASLLSHMQTDYHPPSFPRARAVTRAAPLASSLDSRCSGKLSPTQRITSNTAMPFRMRRHSSLSMVHCDSKSLPSYHTTRRIHLRYTTHHGLPDSCRPTPPTLPLRTWANASRSRCSATPPLQARNRITHTLRSSGRPSSGAHARRSRCRASTTRSRAGSSGSRRTGTTRPGR